MILDESAHVIKTYINGYCFALRFSPEMAGMAILEYATGIPLADWKPYNEMTGDFETGIFVTLAAALRKHVSK
jgi:hypothetical protein